MNAYALISCASVYLPRYSIDVIKGLAPLVTVFEVITKVFGSQTAYTAGLCFAAFESLWNSAAAIDAASRDRPHHDKMKSIAIAFQNSLLERVATHYYATKYWKPAVHAQVCDTCAER